MSKSYKHILIIISLLVPSYAYANVDASSISDKESVITSRDKVVTSALDRFERSAKRTKAEEPQRVIERVPALVSLEEPQPQNYSSQEETDEPFLSTEIKVQGGKREDDFSWNIAGDSQGENPDILSELTWNDLKMKQVSGRAKATFVGNYVVDLFGAYADIYSGSNQDSDYFGDGRTLEFSRSNNKSEDGEAMDLSGGFGYQFIVPVLPDVLALDAFDAVLLGGYSYHEQNLIITDGQQTIPSSGPLPSELHSNYWAEWEGPWFGLELLGNKKKLKGSLRFEYHWADYYGSANWNLRTDFAHPKSFEHIADGAGFLFDLGLGYQLTKSWSLDFNHIFQNWETTDGIDRTFFNDGTIIETRLNEVNWTSYAMNLGVTYKFP